jgi:site-specific DNA recombinase
MAARRNGTGAAAVAVEAPVRCAIYTRVSTEDQAAKDFNSLEAQREAAEAYVLSQRAEGWSALTSRYDDAGISGATLERPGLKRLLADVDAGLVDCIVVYKYDRLSRSMLDFLQLLDLLKKRGVSFVSVSQRFDTSTPVGEMTLNILLSFAQFERQIIAERTRDKIRAARRHGRWTGGMPPLGYRVAAEGGKLVPDETEAEQVREIFNLYIEQRSTLAVSQELTRRGARRKSWTTKTGKAREGREWNAANLHRLLTDPIYIGRQKLGGETFKGEHPAIIPKATFERVQRILDGNRRTSGASHRNRHGALLRGILRCAACDAAMTHAFTERRGKAYRYYRCVNAIKGGTCPTGSVPALKIEALVVDQIRRIGTDPVLRDETFRQVQAQIAAEARGRRAESKRIDRDLAAVRAEVGGLTITVTRASGAAADALMAKLAEAQERLVVLERRQRELADKPEHQAIDVDAVGRALAQFTELWDVLLAPERERVVRLLIERLDYDGENVKFHFSATGANLLAAEATR